MKKNCYDTLIRWDHALREDWVKPKIPEKNRNGIWYYHKAEVIFKKEWLDEWRQKGILLSTIMLFWRPAWFKNAVAHIDILSPTEKDRFAIGAFNGVLGGSDSEMMWFETPPLSEKDYRITQAGTAYLSWPIPNLRETERRTITGPMLSLVRVDVPHAIYVGAEPRWCISIRTADMMSFGSWEAMVDSYAERGIIKD